MSPIISITNLIINFSSFFNHLYRSYLNRFSCNSSKISRKYGVKYDNRCGALPIYDLMEKWVRLLRYSDGLQIRDLIQSEK